VITEAQPLAVSAVLCADWGKEVSKRAVFVADVSTRVVRRLEPAMWTFEEVLAAHPEFRRPANRARSNGVASSRQNSGST
jgi:hypothetical protein